MSEPRFHVSPGSRQQDPYAYSNRQPAYQPPAVPLYPDLHTVPGSRTPELSGRTVRVNSSAPNMPVFVGTSTSRRPIIVTPPHSIRPVKVVSGISIGAIILTVALVALLILIL